MAYKFPKDANPVDCQEIWRETIKRETDNLHVNEEYHVNPNTFYAIPEKPCNVNPKDVLERSRSLHNREYQEKVQNRGMAPPMPRTSNGMYGLYQEELMVHDRRFKHGKISSDETHYAEEAILHSPKKAAF
ncbi:hypothetical protein BLNAU_7269 [Blattamonas nauphoetae]|uniref:Uncharacterized protein n=1 Tax=Blattamonas nauphoetae TaxID=2049346 RepID=A0ABQ9Y276_9EUKA|nr:hypothetical protein BLNAU_7269 [Blattamonas nauphoetae]